MRRYQRMIARAQARAARAARAQMSQTDVARARALLEQHRRLQATPRWKLKAIALLGFLGAAGVGAAATLLIQRWRS